VKSLSVPISDRTAFDWRYPGTSGSFGRNGFGDESLPHAVAHLEAGRHRGEHPGWQLCVLRYGEPVASLACGWARADVPMSVDTLLPLFCCVKPLVAAALLSVLHERDLSVETPVATLLDGFARSGSVKATINLRHVLSHAAGIIPDPAYPFLDAPRDEVWRAIAAFEVPDGVTPGQVAYYGVLTAWFVLAEALEQMQGAPYWETVGARILEPLGVEDVFIGMTARLLDELSPRIGLIYDVDRPEPSVWRSRSRAEHMLRYMPGTMGFGTARALATIMEALSPSSGRRILPAAARSAMTSRHRVGLYDTHSGSFVSWGLGVAVDGWHFGTWCSPATFGHTGINSSFVAVDPENAVTVACIANGATSGRVSRARDRGLVDAVYRDLGLAAASPRSPQIIAVDPPAFGEPRASAVAENRFWQPRGGSATQ
jgi:CubicO group peptidase (beta-lactamase class C family)